MCRGIILQLLATLALRAFQPDPQTLRRLYEEGLAKRELEYGSTDTRTAGAARDLGLYLREWGDDPAGARQALARALAIDEKTLGAMNPQTLADAADLAGLSAPFEAEPLWKRAAGGADNALAARAFSALGEIREAAGDRSGAAVYYRKALVREE